jgi:hypothetical protein
MRQNSLAKNLIWGIIKELQKMSAVYVSALYDLQTIEKNPKRRSALWYIDRIQLILEQKDIAIVIYTDEHLESALQKKCEGHANIQIKVVPFDTLKYVDQLPQMTKNQNHHPYRTNNPAKDTQEYRVIMWNKFEFVADAAQSYPHAQKFIWIDLGIEYVACEYEKNIDLAEIATYFDDSHFCCTIINPLRTEDYENVIECCAAWRYRQVGGFWSIGRQVFNTFLTGVRAEIQTVLDAGCVCMDEEIMARFSYRHPELCRFNFGDYQSCIVNWRGLRYDIHIAQVAVSKAHLYGRYHMASTGWQKLLLAGAAGVYPLTAPMMYDLLCRWYLAAYFVNHSEAVQIAKFIIFSSSIHDYFRAHVVRDTNTLFQYVGLSDLKVTQDILQENASFPFLYQHVSNLGLIIEKK